MRPLRCTSVVVLLPELAIDLIAFQRGRPTWFGPPGPCSLPFRGNDEADQFYASRVREYLWNADFLIMDEFQGTAGWDGCMVGMHMVIFSRAVNHLSDYNGVIHGSHDVDARFKVPADKLAELARTNTQVAGDSR